MFKRSNAHMEMTTDSLPASDRFQYNRKRILWASLLILVSGVTGTIYMSLSAQPGYGPIAFLQGSLVLLPVGAFPILLVEMLLFTTLALAAAGFVLIGRINVTGNPRIKYARIRRISSSLLVVAYLETIVVLVASALIGIQNTQNFPALTFGTGNLFENAFYALSIIFLFSFILFLGAGSFIGTTGSMASAFILSERYEFFVMAPLLLGGIFYYPIFIAAGIIGVFTAVTRTSYLRIVAASTYHILGRAVNRFMVDTRLEVISAALSGTILILLVCISTITVPVYSKGTLIFYVSKYLSGPLLGLVVLGLVASSALFAASMLSIFRERLKLITYLFLAGFILLSSSYLYFQLALEHSSDFVQLTKFQETYAAFPYVFLGAVLAMIPYAIHFAGKKRSDSSAV